MGGKKGFTLVEMLVVIAIIVILAGMVLPVLMQAKKEGLKAECINNMRQFGTAFELAKTDNNERLPGSLTGLFPDYCDNKKLFLCPIDMSFGKEGGKPPTATDQFAETDEAGSSYFYEFSAADCSWDYAGYLGATKQIITGDASGSTEVSWNAAKYYQLYNGDASNGNQAYPPDRFPVVRCFWHTYDPDANKDTVIKNLSYTGRVFESPPQWETAASK